MSLLIVNEWLFELFACNSPFASVSVNVKRTSFVSGSLATIFLMLMLLFPEFVISKLKVIVTKDPTCTFDSALPTHVMYLL